MVNKGVNRGLTALLLLSLAAIMFFAGCGKLENKGPTPTNAAPIAYLANVPVDSASFLANPTVHWYATDRDGYITMYRYAVQTVNDYPDPEAYIEESRQNGWEDWTDVIVETGSISTSGQIRLFAAESAENFVEQYVYIMAVDNFGAESNVPYRLFSRANHAPGTEVSLSRGPWITGSCRASQAQNIGIPVQWEGSDTLDYPGKQPDFEYAWELFGPFDSYIDTTIINPGTDEVDTIYSVIPDTAGINWDSYLLYESYSDLTSSKWTFNQFATLYNLFGDAAVEGVTLFGAFVFKVRTRDDAYVEDPTPAISTFQALKPACERDLMLLDLTTYTKNAGGLCDGCGPGNLREDRYHKYYAELLEEAGGFTFSETDSMSIFPYIRKGDPAKYLPALDLMGRYSLIIIYAEDFAYERKDPWKDAMASYLDMGGNIMVLGNNILQTAFYVNNEQFEDYYPMTIYYGTSSIQYRYFNVQAVWDPGWSFSFKESLVDTAIDNANEEMLIAYALKDGFPDLVPDYCDTIYDELLYADTCHMAEYLAGNTYNVWNGQQPYQYYMGALPGVNYFVSGGYAEGLYMASSAYGVYGPLEGGIVGYRYQTEGFKTSLFGFPLYAFPRWQAVQFLTEMLDWYDLESM